MLRYRRHLARILCGGLAALLVALGAGSPPPALGQAQKEIVVVVKIAGIPWFNRMAVGVQEAGQRLGVKASLVGPSKADAASQVSMVEDLVNKGVPAIAVVPTDSKSLIPVFQKARQKHIFIVTHENPFETQAVDWDIETIDNVAYGKLAVDQIEANLKKMNVQCTAASPCGYVQLVGGLTVPLHNFWADTATKYIKDKFPGLKELTTRLPTAESADDSRRAVLDLVTTYGDKLKAVIGWGSLGPVGAAAAVREKGLQSKLIAGGSAIPSTAVAYLRDGSLKWLQLWDPRDAGFAMVYVAKQLLDGKTPAPGTNIPGLGPIAIHGKDISVNKAVFATTADQAEKFGF